MDKFFKKWQILLFLLPPMLGFSESQLLTDDEIGSEEARESLPEKCSNKDLGQPARTILGITLTKNLTFSEVKEKLGTVEGFSTGDAGGSEYKVVYLIGENDERTAVSFIHGETGSGVEMIRIFDPKYFNLRTAPCLNLKIFKSAIFQNGLKLGLRKEKILKIMGKPDKDSPTDWHYCFLVEKKISETDPLYEEYKKEGQGVEPIYSKETSAHIKFVNDIARLIEIERYEGFPR